jgi:hypothetical protein
MFFRTHVFALVFSLGLFFAVLELVRRRRLLERYSLLWIFIAVAMFVFAGSRRILDVLAKAVGIYYPPAALFLIAMLFVIVLLLHFSLVISRLSEENKVLAQKVAILEHDINSDN